MAGAQRCRREWGHAEIGEVERKGLSHGEGPGETLDYTEDDGRGELELPSRWLTLPWEEWLVG